MRPVAASTIIRPVGVGLMSRGPIGVEGATITAGSPCSAHQAFDFTFGHQLGALVGADHALRRVARGFIHRRVAGLQRRDGGGIDHPLDTGFERGAHGGPGALEIVALDLARVARPQPVIGRDMEQVARAFHGGGHGLFVAHVARHRLAMQLGDVEPVGARPHQDAHMQPARHQRPRHGGADKTGCAGDQSDVTHRGSPQPLAQARCARRFRRSTGPAHSLRETRLAPRHFANRSAPARPARSHAPA